MTQEHEWTVERLEEWLETVSQTEFYADVVTKLPAETVLLLSALLNEDPTDDFLNALFERVSQEYPWTCSGDDTVGYLLPDETKQQLRQYASRPPTRLCDYENCDCDALVQINDEYWCEYHGAEALLSILSADNAAQVIKGTQGHLLKTKPSLPDHWLWKLGSEITDDQWKSKNRFMVSVDPTNLPSPYKWPKEYEWQRVPDRKPERYYAPSTELWTPDWW